MLQSIELRMHVDNACCYQLQLCGLARIPIWPGTLSGSRYCRNKCFRKEKEKNLPSKLIIYNICSLSHLSEVRSRQSTTSHNAFCGPSIKPQMPEVFHICFVGMNRSTVYFSLAFIHVVRMFVVALSLHLSRGRLCLRVHCLIDGILLF